MALLHTEGVLDGSDFDHPESFRQKHGKALRLLSFSSELFSVLAGVP